MDDAERQRRFDDIERLILEEGRRSRSHLDALLTRLEGRLVAVEWRATGIENIEKTLSAELRGLVARIDRLGLLRR
jgi:hypothetical protein